MGKGLDGNSFFIAAHPTVDMKIEGLEFLDAVPFVADSPDARPQRGTLVLSAWADTP